MGFLAFCKVEAAMRILAIYSNTGCNGEAATRFLAICNHTNSTKESCLGVPGHLQQQ